MYRRFVLNFLKKLNLESLPDHTEDSLVHRFAGEIHLHQWEIVSLEKLVHSDEGDFIELLHQADLILVSFKHSLTFEYNFGNDFSTISGLDVCGTIACGTKDLEKHYLWWELKISTAN